MEHAFKAYTSGKLFYIVVNYNWPFDGQHNAHVALVKMSLTPLQPVHTM